MSFWSIDYPIYIPKELTIRLTLNKKNNIAFVMNNTAFAIT
jgi:hypothetical protein